MWTKFNYRDFEEGLFWLLQMSPVHECDIGISGEFIGLSTGQNKIDSVLAWVETGPNLLAIKASSFKRNFRTSLSGRTGSRSLKTLSSQ